MYMLQLFDSADPVHPVDARLLRDGLITIGRDSNCDWAIVDPDRGLSRTHCEISAVPDGLLVRSLGTNGVFDDASGARLPDSIGVPVAPPFTMRLGRFRLQLAHAGLDLVDRDPGKTMVLTPPLGLSVAVPDNWADAVPSQEAHGPSLVEAFCRGAGLEASELSSDDPAEILERVGAVYRQLVLGLADLMTERERARSRYDLSRTTIGGSGNNPFKWAPTQRLAIDMLLPGSGGFLSGPSAVSSSLQELKLHLIATFAGLQGSLHHAVGQFAPDELDKAVSPRVSLLRNRGALVAEEVAARHGELARQLSGEPGSLEHAFVQAYSKAEAAAERDA